MSEYDWGVTPQQSQQQPTPSPAPQKSRVPKGVLIAGGAVLGVVALGFGGLVAASAMRGGPENPAGVSDEQAASYFAGYSLSTCDFGEDFYRQAGIHEVEVTKEGCAGWTIPTDGQPSVLVWMEEMTPESDSGDPIPGESLEGWSAGTSYLLMGGESYDTALQSDIDTCLARPSNARMGDWVVASTGPCGAISPLAAQLENLTRQQAWNEADRGIFDFESHAGYLDAGTPSFELYTASAWTDSDIVEPEAIVKAPQTFFDNSTVSVSNPRIRDGEMCIDATFTPGEKREGPLSTFYLPDFEVTWADGTRAALFERSSSSLRLAVGESTTYSACGDFTDTVRNGDFLLTQTVNVFDEDEPPAWRFPAESGSRHS